MNGTWLTLFAVGAATLGYRLSCIEFSASASAWLARPAIRRLLRFVPPAAFAALVAPAVLLRDGALITHPTDPRLLAALVALAAALVTRNVLVTLVSGMVALHVVPLLFGGLGP
ncbi:AzlD domain-containing protein [Pendulispora albinea]|uniref:AzlD domain-containing protein n=1 Tax=Pendulispora albinea TaxID=2741071 RepID=A0ABZ2M3A4_9BACT